MCNVCKKYITHTVGQLFLLKKLWYIRSECCMFNWICGFDYFAYPVAFTNQMQNTCCHGTGIETNIHMFKNHLQPKKNWGGVHCSSHTVSAGRARGDHARVLQSKLWEINIWEPFVLPVLSQLQSHHLDTWNPLYYRGTESQTDSQKITNRERSKNGRGNYHLHCSFHQPVCFIRAPSLFLIVTQSFPKHTRIHTVWFASVCTYSSTQTHCTWYIKI